MGEEFGGRARPGGLSGHPTADGVDDQIRGGSGAGGIESSQKFTFRDGDRGGSGRGPISEIGKARGGGYVYGTDAGERDG